MVRETTSTPVVVDAFREGNQLLYWCWPCGRFHLHGAVNGQPGAGDGHRVAHCDPRFPDADGAGIVLREIGPLTDEIRRLYGRERKLSRCTQCRQYLPRIGNSCPTCGHPIHAGKSVKRGRR